MPKRVLVADDDPGILDVMAEFFGEHGFEVLRAANGLEALLHVKRERPESVILDIQMPRLGGLDALKRIRAFDPAIQVVIVSGALDPETRRQALTDGAAGVFHKPLVLGELLSTITSAASPASSTPSVAAAPSVAPAPEVPRVLVVDDDPDTRTMLEEFLRLQGYAAQTASGGAEAIREITRAEPDVILLDITMPGLSGVDALLTIRALAPGVTVIMVSGSADVDASRLALARGAFDYVIKPVDFDYLTRSIETAMAMKGLEG